MTSSTTFYAREAVLTEQNQDSEPKQVRAGVSCLDPGASVMRFIEYGGPQEGLDALLSTKKKRQGDTHPNLKIIFRKDH